MGRDKRIWYLSLMRAAKVQASLRICAVSPEPSLLAHTSSESRGTFRQKARSLAPLNGWACAVKICHDGMLEDTNLLDGAQMINESVKCVYWSLLRIQMPERMLGSTTDIGEVCKNSNAREDAGFHNWHWWSLKEFKCQRGRWVPQLTLVKSVRIQMPERMLGSTTDIGEVCKNSNAREDAGFHNWHWWSL